MQDATEMLGRLGDEWATFRKRSESKVDKMSADLDSLAHDLADLQLKAGRPNLSGTGRNGDPAERKALERGIRSLFEGKQGQADAAFAEIKGMAVGSDPDGGYLDSPMISDQMTRVMLEVAPVLGRVRTVTMTHGNVFEEPVDRNSAAASWTGELSARTETTAPAMGRLSIPLCEIYSMPAASQTLIDGANIDIVRWLTDKIAEQFAAKEADAIFNGTGVGQPRGFLTLPTAATADSSRDWGTIEYVASGKSAAFASVAPADKLIDLQHKLKSQYAAGAVWVMSRATSALVRQIKDSQSRYLWQDSMALGQPPTLLGHEVILCEEMPAVAANSYSIAFVNFERAITRIEKPGVKLLVDPFTDKPNVRLYSYRRVGAAPANSEAIKLLKFAVS